MARIFLSYASDQHDFADQINLSLVSRGHDVFFDRDDLPEGETFEAQIEKGVKRSDILLFLISPQSVQDGRFTRTELKYARAKWPTPDGRVLPVMVEPTPMNDIPAYLKAVTILEPSGSASAEIASAVDELARALRRKGRGLRVAIATLAVGLIAGLGFNFDRISALLSGEATSAIASVSTGRCFGPQLYDAVAKGNLSYTEAKSLGQMCANELLPAVSEGSPVADQKEAFAKDFAAAATSDSDTERRAAATITQGDASNAIESFFALARSASDDDAKARHFRAAAALAFQVDPPKAIEALEQVVALEPDDLNGWAMLGSLYRATGDRTSAERVAGEMTARAGNGGLDWEANATLEEARRQMSIGNLETGLTELRQARRIFEQTGNRWGVAQSLLVEAELMLMKGDTQTAENVSNDALILAENYKFPDVTAAAKMTKGRAMMGRLQFEEARTFFEEAESGFRSLNNDYGAVFAANQLGLLAMNQGDLVEAKAIFTKVREDQARLGFREGEAWADLYLGQVEQFLGQLATARTAYESAEKIFDEIGNPMGLASAIMANAQVYGFQGRPDRALSEFQKARDIARTSGIASLEAQALMGSAYIHRSNGDQESAIVDYEQGLALFDSSRNALGALWALEQLGQMARAREDRDKARSLWTRALSISREQGLADTTQRLEYELSQL